MYALHSQMCWIVRACVRARWINVGLTLDCAGGNQMPCARLMSSLLPVNRKKISPLRDTPFPPIVYAHTHTHNCTKHATDTFQSNSNDVGFFAEDTRWNQAITGQWKRTASTVPIVIAATGSATSGDSAAVTGIRGSQNVCLWFVCSFVQQFP